MFISMAFAFSSPAGLCVCLNLKAMNRNSVLLVDIHNFIVQAAEAY